jgi:hypothetical protein
MYRRQQEIPLDKPRTTTRRMPWLDFFILHTTWT